MPSAPAYPSPSGAPEEITGYHAHVYYDAPTKARAAEVREAVEARFADITMGRWHDEPVGPHPRGSYQIAFEPALFGALVPWLMANRDDLTVFIHPLTGDVIREHTDLAAWLGRKEELRLEVLRRFVAETAEKREGTQR